MTTMGDYLKLKAVDVGAVRWGDGFWGYWFELSQSSILPNMKKALDEPSNGAVMGNFHVAAGLQEGKHRGTFWSDGDCYKWMEALAHVYGVTKDRDIPGVPLIEKTCMSSIFEPEAVQLKEGVGRG